MEFGHVYTAMVTPFDEKGALHPGRLEKLIDHLLANGTDALVVAGTTGESATLSTVEKLELFQRCVDYVKKRVPVIAGTGSNDTKSSVELTEKAEAIGVDGIMLVTPYYNKPSQKGLYEHFKTIAGHTSLPVMLYNVPGRTALHMEAETVIALSKIKNITAVKESSGDLEHMAKLITETADDFILYTGDDGNTLPAMAIGTRGVVSVASHIIGAEMQTMISHFLDGNVGEAAALHRQLLPTMQAMFSAPNPTCVKYALEAKGIDVGSVRLPLVPLDEQQKKKIDAVLI